MDHDFIELGAALEAVGFAPHEDAAEYFRAISHELGMQDNGPYEVLACWTRGQTVVLVEQNTAPDDLGGGMTAVITHPPVAVIEGPRGRVAASPLDVALVVDQAKEVSKD